MKSKKWTEAEINNLLHLVYVFGKKEGVHKFAKYSDRTVKAVYKKYNREVAKANAKAAEEKCYNSEESTAEQKGIFGRIISKVKDWLSFLID